MSLDDYYNELDKSNDCANCGTPIDEDKTFCSKECLNENYNF